MPPANAAVRPGLMLARASTAIWVASFGVNLIGIGLPLRIRASGGSYCRSCRSQSFARFSPLSSLRLLQQLENRADAVAVP
jgi:hypothetical protein